jgi:hypothetical protein
MTTQTNKNTAEDKVKIKTMNHGAYNSSWRKDGRAKIIWKIP